MIYLPAAFLFSLALTFLSGSFELVGMDERIPFRSGGLSEEEWAAALSYFNEELKIDPKGPTIR